MSKLKIKIEGMILNQKMDKIHKNITFALPKKPGCWNW